MLLQKMMKIAVDAEDFSQAEKYARSGFSQY